MRFGGALEVPENSCPKEVYALGVLAHDFQHQLMASFFDKLGNAWVCFGKRMCWQCLGMLWACFRADLDTTWLLFENDLRRNRISVEHVSDLCWVYVGHDLDMIWTCLENVLETI